MSIQPKISKEECARLKELGLAVIRNEADAICALQERINDDFTKACAFLLHCRGRIVVTGMGKSGHIGGKIAATLASTGSPAFFVHPGEASHGDLGMITPDDVVIALSNSGETCEILTIVPIIKREKVPLIGMTGNPQSTLAIEADVNIDVSVKVEACPLGLAPTSSTTATLAMGDALAIALLEAKGFTEKDFARSHPGGSLGKRLLLHISEVMHIDEEMPVVTETAPLTDALLEMTKKGLGMTAVVNAKNELIGVYTDGDLRRTLDLGKNIQQITIASAMTKNPIHITHNMLAAEALSIMEDKNINGLFLVDDKHQLIGALNMHDLLRAGLV